MVNYMDPRSTVGRMSRGNNVYRGVSNAPNTSRTRRRPAGWGGSGASQYTPPPSPTPSPTPTLPPAPLQPYVPPPGYYPTPAPTGMGDYDPSAIINPAGGGSGNPVGGGGTGGGGTAGMTYEQFLAQVMAGLPGLNTFDPLYEDLFRILQEQAGVLDVTEDRETDRINNQYDIILARLQENLGKSLESNEYNMADRGILRSGINVREQGRINENYSQQNADTVGQQAAMLEQLIAQITQARNSLIQEGQQAQIDRAQRAQEAQQYQAAQAAQAAAYMYGAQLMGQQPVPGPTGQYEPPTPAPGSHQPLPPSSSPPPITFPPSPSMQPPIPGTNMLGNAAQPHQGGPVGVSQAGNFGRQPPNPAAPATPAPVRQPQNSWTRPATNRSAYIPPPNAPSPNLTGAIERRLRRF